VDRPYPGLVVKRHGAELGQAPVAATTERERLQLRAAAGAWLCVEAAVVASGAIEEFAMA
jgi:hypothetical protein